MGIDNLFKMITSSPIMVTTEKEVQSELEGLLIKNSISNQREFKLSDKDIPDFMLDDGTIIEVKIKGPKRSIYRQIERYAKDDKVKTIVLITNRSLGFPSEINSKPCYVINLSLAWL